MTLPFSTCSKAWIYNAVKAALDKALDKVANALLITKEKKDEHRREIKSKILSQSRLQTDIISRPKKTLSRWQGSRRVCLLSHGSSTLAGIVASGALPKVLYLRQKCPAQSQKILTSWYDFMELDLRIKTITLTDFSDVMFHWFSVHCMRDQPAWVGFLGPIVILAQMGF